MSQVCTMDLYFGQSFIRFGLLCPLSPIVLINRTNEMDIQLSLKRY